MQALQFQNNSTTHIAGGITEIILPNSWRSEVYLPTLAFLSREGGNRWLTWLAPAGIKKSDLQRYNFDWGKTRFIYPKDNDHCFWLFWEALTEGNSHTVIGTPGTLTDQQMNRLESAALIGKCNALILRDRASYS